MKWTPDKLTALVLVVGCLVLVFTGIDGEVKTILTMSATYLFVTGVVDYRAKKQSKND